MKNCIIIVGAIIKRGSKIMKNCTTIVGVITRLQGKFLLIYELHSVNWLFFCVRNVRKSSEKETIKTDRRRGRLR